MLELEVRAKEMKLNTYLDHTGEFAQISNAPPLLRVVFGMTIFLLLLLGSFHSSAIDLCEVIKW
jgi:hypothetical protein